MPKIYKIGTRGSLLALTQCNQVKDQLEKLTGDKFELDIIKTQGDLITNAPLWQLDGKDFFTKELDEALLSGKVDLVVHSYKDLGSVRPEGITLAAVTKRTYAHDILLIKKSTVPLLKEKKEFIVGTSSPRRMINLKNNLKDFIPAHSEITISTKVLRGNVNTRIQKLRDDEFDAIVLALPGIERLALTESSRLELEKLVENLTFMILPQSVFPSSASQGALGIECKMNREDNGQLLSKLKLMEDQTTKEEVSRERFSFNEYGGGCHLAVGINVRKIGNFFLHTHKGELDNKVVNKSYLEGRSLPKNTKALTSFIGLPTNDQLIEKQSLNPKIETNKNLYISSNHCIDSIPQINNSLWAAGTKTFKNLCKKRFWVNGSSDSLGDDEINNLKKSQALSLMTDLNSILVLTNDESPSTVGTVIATYTRALNKYDENFKNKITTYDAFYWTSFFQYQAYTTEFPELKNKIHACGLGKTYQHFIDYNINVIPFSSIEEFNAWTHYENK